MIIHGIIVVCLHMLFLMIFKLLMLFVLLISSPHDSLFIVIIIGQWCW